MRIGHGYDIHRMVEGDGIVLGGVPIACDYKLVAHSDGDVVLHALCDALLGAASLGDIGQHFPDDDKRNANCSSQVFLQHIFSLVTERGYLIGNVDISIIAEAPTLKKHLATMRDNIAICLQTAIENINLKATTNEGLDALGEKRGIAAHAVVLLINSNRKEK